jgi:hypothetical protein
MKFDSKYLLIALVLLGASLSGWALSIPDTATIATITLKQWIGLLAIMGSVVGGYFNISTAPVKTLQTALNMPPGATLDDLKKVTAATDPGSVPTPEVAAAILSVPAGGK